MVSRAQKNQNTLNSFLDNYFNAILAGGLILFLVASYIFFLAPKFQATQAAINADIAEQRDLEASSQQKLVNLKALAEIYQKIDPNDLQKFNSVLPNDYVPERLFGEIEEIISRGGWLLGTLSISKSADSATAASSNPRLGTISLGLSLSAVDYSGLKNLLKMLENNLRLFDVTSVSFSPSSNSASLVLTTYYYKPAP